MTSILKSENITVTDNGVSQDIRVLFSFSIIFFSVAIRLLCIGSHNLLVEETYYWNYSQHLDFGYLDHPPMVALLIKISTLIFGTNEFAVRIPALLCWGGAAFFSFKLTELIHRGAGLYAVLLLSLMPFYFIQSTLITPDQPVLLCWSATLYYFYRIFIFDESNSWYKAGIWLGLGMLSKYTIVLLGPAVLLYLITVPSARYWFIKKEPYLCALIALLFFTPVIYWNFMHEWASFVFQSVRRFKPAHRFSFHHFIGLVFLFLLPSGVMGLYLLWNKKSINIEVKTQRFLQIFTLFPLGFFGVYSLNHAIRLDWIGPGLISIIPWLALLISKNKFHKEWHLSSFFLLPCYVLLIVMIAFGVSEKASKIFFQKMISWENLAAQFHDLAKNVSDTRNIEPILVPLDAYNVGSELAFYQAKLLEHGKIQNIYPVIGRHIFGMNSLMYQYWSNATMFSGRILILISTDPKDFNLPYINSKIVVLDSPKKLWSHSQGSGKPISPYYYELVQMR
ncbi:glycosyltransferase family 39 protein [Legionella tucsonensis]|uniref:Dolichyl-phosphate mannosyltransferase n=1 Tax=Legionella tucsonensis TaxID=40335 RepID=A0A0W0ZPW3_9GAMM|nr:glycosyltransferase family 39 protein [Legionella tucsonensis]KTD71227.1 dolichyl-phosphate mannosyltransferase [Legionella tucsonensis]